MNETLTIILTTATTITSSILPPGLSLGLCGYMKTPALSVALDKGRVMAIKALKFPSVRWGLKPESHTQQSSKQNF